MRLKVLTLLIIILFLFGCQKHGLTIEFPTNDEKQTLPIDEIPEREEKFSTMPSTRALIMSNGDFDMTTIAPRELTLEFPSFRIKLFPDETNSFHKVMVQEPKDYHNGFTIESLLDKEGRILRQAYIQKQNGLVVGFDEFILHYPGEQYDDQ